MRQQHKAMAVALGVVAVVVGLASGAWACTSSASLQPATPAVGEPGNTVRVVGKNFANTVELHWATNDGPLLASVGGPSLAVDVAIPSDAQPGVAYIVALSRNADGTIAGKASVPFNVAGGEAAKSVWLDSKPASRDSSPTLPVGMGLLALGLVGLFAGSLISVTARRRARAGTTGR